MSQSQPPHPRLVLGTVQLGLPYGIANRSGMPSEAEAVALVRQAIAAGVATIDTARAYGEAEARVGLALKGLDRRPEVVTKLDPLAGLAPDASEGQVERAVCVSLDGSRRALGLDRLDTVLLHRAAHRTAWGGLAWRTLVAQRKAGRIGRVGVSVQSSEELLAALEDGEVAHVQLPFNMLDYRWREAGCLERLAKRSDVVVHVRSVYLQGLLASPRTARWPPVEGVDAADLTQRLEATAARLGRRDTADLALAFVRAQDWIDGIVIGMETLAQLDANVAAFGERPLAREEIDVIERLPRQGRDLLDPAKWS